MTRTVVPFPNAAPGAVAQEGPDFTPAGWGRRLVAGLVALEVPSGEWPAAVAAAGQVTIRTARRWLAGESQPTGCLTQGDVAKALGLNRAWLLYGESPVTEAEAATTREREHQLLEAYRQNPPWRQRLLRRMVARMANRSPLIERLKMLQDEGQLSPEDFLRLAGQ